MKKIILIVVGIIFVTLLGRLGWAYYQVKSDETKISNTSSLIPPTSKQTVNQIAMVPIRYLKTEYPNLDIGSEDSIKADAAIKNISTTPIYVRYYIYPEHSDTGWISINDCTPLCIVRNIEINTKIIPSLLTYKSGAYLKFRGEVQEKPGYKLPVLTLIKADLIEMVTPPSYEVACKEAVINQADKLSLIDFLPLVPYEVKYIPPFIPTQQQILLSLDNMWDGIDLDGNYHVVYSVHQPDDNGLVANIMCNYDGKTNSVKELWVFATFSAVK